MKYTHHKNPLGLSSKTRRIVDSVFYQWHELGAFFIGSWWPMKYTMHKTQSSYLQNTQWLSTKTKRIVDCVFHRWNQCEWDTLFVLRVCVWAWACACACAYVGGRRVMAHFWMSHVTHVNETRQITHLQKVYNRIREWCHRIRKWCNRIRELYPNKSTMSHIRQSHV